MTANAFLFGDDKQDISGAKRNLLLPFPTMQREE